MECRAINQASAEAEILSHRFRTLAKGEVLTYDDIAQACGGDMRARRGPIHTAIRRVLREGIVIHCVRGAGYMRATDDDAVMATERDITHCARRTRRARQQLHSVEFSSLCDEAKLHHQLNGAVLAALAAVSNGKRRSAQRRKLEAGATQVDMCALLEAAKGGAA
jgi:hypothetical protein